VLRSWLEVRDEALVHALFGSLSSRRPAPPCKGFSHSLTLLPSHPTRPHAIRHAFTESARALSEFSDTNTPGPCRGHECTRFMRTRPHSFDPICLHVSSTFIHWAVAIPNSLYLSIESRECTLLVIYTFSCRASFPFTPATVLVIVPISSSSSHFDHTSLPFHTLYSFVLVRLCTHDILPTVCFPVDDRPPPT
jgi:hypothetical protein